MGKRRTRWIGNCRVESWAGSWAAGGRRRPFSLVSEPLRPCLFRRRKNCAYQRSDLGYLVTHPHAERPAPYKFVTEDASMLDIAVSLLSVSWYDGVVGTPDLRASSHHAAE